MKSGNQNSAWTGTANKESSAWAALCARLQHLPAMTAPMDGRRVMLPREYRDVLRETAQQKDSSWLLAFRAPGILALVPQFLWDKYLEILIAELRAQNLYTPNYFQITFVDTHRPVAVDSRGRFQIPEDMVYLVNRKAAVVRDPSTLVIRPQQAYLELLSKPVYKKTQHDAQIFMEPYFDVAAPIATQFSPPPPDAKHTGILETVLAANTLTKKGG